MRGFFAGIGVGLVLLALLALETTGLYIAGRIVLPELGIHPLSWQTIFWASAWLGAFSAPMYVVIKQAEAA